MAVYTVYVMPDHSDTVLAADRVRFVSDRFAVPALLFGPIWLACHRLWWVLIAYILALAALLVAGHEWHLPAVTIAFVLLIFGVFLGLESAALQEFALSRRGYRVADLVSAPSREAAEREFFRRWNTFNPSVRGARSATMPPRGDDGQIIGVFPTAGGVS